jgi:hypothetical protein
MFGDDVLGEEEGSVRFLFVAALLNCCYSTL